MPRKVKSSDKKDKKKGGPRSLTIYDDGRIVWDGFDKTYELVGFVHLFVDPQKVVSTILKTAQGAANKQKKEE